ncbi:MAG: chlorite dismutase family protein [Thermomicrobiales bacterium]
MVLRTLRDPQHRHARAHQDRPLLPHRLDHLTYSFGLDDQEFVAFESDHPEDFLDLVEELRGSVSSSFTARDVPIFSCIATEIRDVLTASAGTRAAVAICSSSLSVLPKTREGQCGATISVAPHRPSPNCRVRYGTACTTVSVPGS